MQGVTGVPRGMQQLNLEGFVDLGSKSADMGFYHRCTRVEIEIPHLFQILFAALGMPFLSGQS
jgi:hypothetical protein